jgi:mono/diheme cytochrome c family protein
MTGDRGFASYCAGCHGGDGKGSDKAPGIAVMPDVIAMTDTQLADVVTNGTQAGMPSFGRLGSENVQNIVRYLRTLQGVPSQGGGGGAAQAAAAGGRGNGGGGGGGRRGGGANANAGGGRAAGAAVSQAAPTGNVANGKTLFFGTKAQCSTCHSISGEGGVSGADMTAYGAAHDAAAIQQAIVNGPAPAGPPARGGGGGGFGGGAPAKPVEVKTKSGQTITGMVRGDDNLHITVQTQTGRYYFFDRGSVASVNYLKSLHPADYGTRLSPTELNDIVSFLIVTGRAAPTDPQPAAAAGRGRRGGGL